MSEISAIRRKGITPYILPPKIYKGTRNVYDSISDTKIYNSGSGQDSGMTYEQ